MVAKIFFFASKEAYPIVRQLEKKRSKKVQAKVVKCAKNKCWVHKNPPPRHLIVNPIWPKSRLSEFWKNTSFRPTLLKQNLDKKKYFVLKWWSKQFCHIAKNY